MKNRIKLILAIYI